MIRLERPPCPNPTALATNYKHPDNKGALKQAAHDKCMYCESKISHIGFARIDHIRPKESFPDLEFTWDNLGYSCEKCNNAKHDKYHATTPFIDPYAECPKPHIYAFGTMLRPKNGSERGEITIKDIQLNRPALLEKRNERLEELDKAIKACYRTQNATLRQTALLALEEEASADKEYSMFTRAMLDSHTAT
ncbi:MAG: HNH endonuclease [Alphaproteobacteria bacterium]|nr:HNH endonuclease [Alphaproteobacteria bacterium]